ncbi:MAG: peptidase T [Bacteroidales bacterium]
MTVIDRFLQYVKYNTQSDDLTNMIPSTPGQLIFAQALEVELRKLGLKEITLDENGYLMATLPSNCGDTVPTIGFIAHLDTSPDITGRHVSPRIVEDYDGKDIILNSEKNIVIRTSEFPELLSYIGDSIIVTDGNTLLGADDKAGIAEIITAIDYLKKNPDIKHGKIRIAFTPDEEIGKGPQKFNIEQFGADWAYTMDGGEVGELEYENFNAAIAKINIKGRNVHPGYAKGKMINSIHLSKQFANALPQDETPEHTEGYEGFFHLVGIEGSVESTTLTYIIRDHNSEGFAARKQLLEDITNQINQEYPNVATIQITDQYHNMREKIADVMHIVDIAIEAMETVGVKPLVRPIRGGTDGAQLSFMGLPCPNIFAGGVNFHAREEFIPISSMNSAVNVIVEICKIVARGY